MVFISYKNYTKKKKKQVKCQRSESVDMLQTGIQYLILLNKIFPLIPLFFAVLFSLYL